MKTLNEWLAQLESVHGSHIDLSLDRMQKAAAELGLSTLSMPVITVGGTNGKGSVVCALEHIYFNAGFRVGSYTSPHLFQFNERIKINTKMVSDECIVNALSATHAMAGLQQLTYFETITLAALWIFKHANLDVLILEVGLGGRLDAVNVIDPSLAIITSIDLDHTDRLGNTREAIAKEKAGIFRKNIPVVCGDLNPPAVLKEMAQALNAFFYQVTEHPVKSKIMSQNANTATAAIKQLQHLLPVPPEAIENALNTINPPGRQQILFKKCKHIIDVAHNPAGLSALAKKILQEKGEGRVLLVISMLQDKDIAASFNALIGVTDRWFVAPLENERAANALVLQNVLSELAISNGVMFNNLKEAYFAALKTADAHDLIVITGSFFTVATLAINT